jgi:hypothetical protein
MNERIRQLAEQADLVGTSGTSVFTGRPPGYVTEEQILKFAELIVRDCISTLEEKIHRSIDNEGDEIWADLILKEHFGVEE